MGENSSIEWTHHTFNPWIGCTKVAEGCTNCYAESHAKRTGQAIWGPAGTRVKTSAKYWQQPRKWNAAAAAAGERRRVFCASLADVFEDWDGPIVDSHGDPIVDHDQSAIKMPQVRQMLFDLIDETPNLDWLLLTKRPENISKMWAKKPGHPWLRKLHNVWLLTSVATQADADRNVPLLLKCRELVPVLGLSAEPLLGPVNLDRWNPDYGVESEKTSSIDWVIVGGESGHHARPIHPDWVRSIRDQCAAADVPFFFKQWGEWLPFDQVRSNEQREACSVATKKGQQDYFGSRVVHGPQGLKTGTTPGVRPVGIHRIGKKLAGRLLDGKLHDEYPRVEIHA